MYVILALNKLDFNKCGDTNGSSKFKKEAAQVERNGYINQSLKEAQKLVGLRKFKDF